MMEDRMEEGGKTRESKEEEKKMCTSGKESALLSAGIASSDLSVLLTKTKIVRTAFGGASITVTDFDVDLEEQTELLDELATQVVKHNMSFWNSVTPTDHFILFIGGACGIGKTRLGKELYLHCSKSLKDSMYMIIKVSDEIGADLAMNVGTLLIEMAAKYRRKVENDNPLVIFLHIDEFQRLNLEDFKMIHKNLTSFMAGGSDAAKMQHKIQLIPMLTGVPAGLVVTETLSQADSKVSGFQSRVYLATPRVLSFPASKRFLLNVLREFVQRERLDESLIEGFMQNEGVMCTLASLSGFPRPIELLARMLVLSDASISSDPKALYRAVSAVVSKTTGAVSWINLLDRPVSRSASKDAKDAMERLIYLSLTSQYVPVDTTLNGKGLTIQQAEAAGFCVLKHVTKAGERHLVQPMLSLVFLGLINGLAIKVVPNTFLNTWDRFEEFVAHIFKNQINATFAIRGKEPLTLAELFPNILFSKSAGEIRVYLNKIKKVCTAEQTPGNLSKVSTRHSKGTALQTIDITEGDYILVNGAKAKSVDICLVLNMKSSVKLLLSIQVKHTEMDADKSSTLSVDLLKEEHWKSTTVMEKCSANGNHFAKTVFITISNRDEGKGPGHNEELDYLEGDEEPVKEEEHEEKEDKEEGDEDKDTIRTSKLAAFLATAREPIGLVCRPNFKQFLSPTFDSFAYLKTKSMTSKVYVVILIYKR